MPGDTSANRTFQVSVELSEYPVNQDIDVPKRWHFALLVGWLSDPSASFALLRVPIR
jgi:hypothetical protein